MTEDPGEVLMNKVREQGEEIKWNGHMRHGDDIILMLPKTEEDVMTYIETDEEGIDELISKLETAKGGFE